ncbi:MULTISPECIES: hypothetical protein [unclassified Adlercreutzia]|uniref:hypothetical protein n=1 Tax=unclassified Adlercreutzia TaxID=2636013 RepID=UPI0013EC5696|nr:MULTISPECIES: hypothetical protein [unclassified Adlercreutzia]
MSKKRQRREEALAEIAQLRDSRRANILICVCAFAMAVIVIAASIFALSRASENMIVRALVMFASIGLAIQGGSASMKFTKSGNRIKYLKQSLGITDEDIKTFCKN